MNRRDVGSRCPGCGSDNGIRVHGDRGKDVAGFVCLECSEFAPDRRQVQSDARIDELVDQRIHELVEWYRTFGPIELDEFDRHRGNE